MRSNRRFLSRGSGAWLACVLGASATASFANPVQADAGYRSADARIQYELRRTDARARSGSCGVERWQVKTGSDGAARRVDVSHPAATRIADLLALRAPSKTPNTRRVPPTETTAWSIDATLVQYRMEGDSDYRLVLRDEQGRTLIAEIPDPACVSAKSAFAADIARVRRVFDAQVAATSRFKNANLRVHLTGVGFFDARNDLDGVAPNGFELHPVVGLAFGPGRGSKQP